MDGVRNRLGKRSVPPLVRAPRVLAGASGGGHWVELLRLRGAFEGLDVAYVSTFPSYAEVVKGNRYYAVPDASRFRLWPFLAITQRALWILLKERPEVIVTTGSAPMLPFVLIGRVLGVRTLWIDSISCPEKLSTSGRIAKHLAERCISQWPEVASAEGLDCWGNVL